VNQVTFAVKTANHENLLTSTVPIRVVILHESASHSRRKAIDDLPHSGEA
jgi:hypothetical protein